MEERTRPFNLRPLLVALAAIVAAAALWAATGLAAGSSSSTEPATSNDPIAVYVQEDDGTTSAPGDCPAEGSGGDSGSSDSGSTDF